ncbi:hypothetical protein [Agrococcus sp. ProA11]|uniref:hypothetical protein n=1 Tax=Agrococcus chionoecetis TaxID=3153752 RepID=UPI0032607C40
MRLQRSRSPRTAGIALALTAGLLVTGCGLLPAPSLPPVPSATTQPAPTGGNAQSAQCERLLADVRGIAVDVARVGELLANDPLGAIALIANVSGRIGDLQVSITDPALLERIDEIQRGWDALVEDASASVAEGDTGGIDRAVAGLTQLGEQVTALQEYCAGAE